MSEKVSENIEEYLEVLYKNGCQGSYVNTTLISKKLDIAPGSVTQMLKKLDDLGYIKHIPYKGAILTRKGLVKSKKITRKHRILEKFLKEQLKIRDDKLHEEACLMEHSLSDDAERSMCQILEHPSYCPGNHFIPECDLNLKNCVECFERSDENVEEIGSREKILISLYYFKNKMKKDINVKISFIRGDEAKISELIEKGIEIGTVANLSFDENNVMVKTPENEINFNDSEIGDIFVEVIQ